MSVQNGLHCGPTRSRLHAQQNDIPCVCDIITRFGVFQHSHVSCSIRKFLHAKDNSFFECLFCLSLYLQCKHALQSVTLAMAVANCRQGQIHEVRSSTLL
eukprot:1187771-Amphidinium_carterae.1